ncbi:hypothetical protein, partial [Holospora obtusa]|uniref:hypothetical protein n=1 Tax=Holospora obtusa TaxID=49893 RepID=UPI0012EB0686
MINLKNKMLLNIVLLFCVSSVGYSEYSKALAELFRNSPKTEVFWDRMDGFLRKKSALTIFR